MMGTSLFEKAKAATGRNNKPDQEPDTRQKMPKRPVKPKEPGPPRKERLVKQFRYVGYELKTGAKRQGAISGLDENDAKEQLRKQGIVPDSLLPASSTLAFLNTDFQIGSGRIKDKEIAAVARQLAVFEGSGLSTFKAIGMIAKELPDGSAMGTVLRDVHRSVANGDDLAAAFRRHEDKIGELTVALIDAGERSATLNKTLMQLAAMTERQVKLKRKVRSSMAYPLAIATMSILAVIASLLFVIPTFEEVYVDFGIELPFLTRMLLKTSEILQRFVWALPAVPIATIILWRRARRDKDLGPRIDMALMRIPLIGSLLQKSVISRVADTLAVMLTAGVPALKAIDMAGASAGNKAVRNALSRGRVRHQEGARLSEAIQNEPAIPEVLPALLAQGEATSNPEELLASFAEMTQDEVDAKVVALTELLQPLMMLVVMLLIGVLGIGIYLPILSLYDQFVA